MYQVLILLLGGSAIWAVGSESRRSRFWGCVLGLLSQPFWLWESAQAKQWGVFILSLWYCYAWARGVLNNKGV